uniref:Uncharacterized protein n=1 Tax=Anguilla anguilla TaxID=7936 RepID=A0A0E9RNT6_ANGAN
MKKHHLHCSQPFTIVCRSAESTAVPRVLLICESHFNAYQ